MKKTLDVAERDFFSLVNQAILANPFGDRRAAIDLRIAEQFAKPSRQAPVDRAVQEVSRRIRRLEKNGFGCIERFAPEDRELMRRSFLFDAFHQFAEQFDGHIRNQLAAGDDPLPVEFAVPALDLFRRRGFTAAETLRNFALCFQVRRAFFFIDQGLLGDCTSMRDLRRKLWNNVFTHDLALYDRYLWDRMEDFSTLILGETGSGKGTAAAAIGRSGFIPFDPKRGAFVESFARSFISLNLSQFSEALIESELFGHKKGAFTGAVGDYKGVLDRCSPCGAIFLDEIGEVTEPVQIKLLQVLQERCFSPVGSHVVRRFRGRVIAATNRPLARMRREKRLRDDFFYRLCSDIITVPPLRQRIRENPAELEDLLAFTIRRILGRSSGEMQLLVRDVITRDLGKEYRWPGNVRELEQCVRRVMLDRRYAGDGTAGQGDLQMRWLAALENRTLDAQHLLAGYCDSIYRQEKSYEAVARRTQLDRRTVKRYIQLFAEESETKDLG